MNKKLLILIIVLAVMVTAFLVACNPAEPSVDYIEVHSSPEIVYIQGQSFNATGGQILVHFEDNTQKLIPLTEDMLSQFDPNHIGEQILQINYQGKRTNIKVIVKPADIKSVNLIISSKTKVNYIEEQLLSVDEMFLSVIHASDHEEIIPVTAQMVSGYNPTKIGDQRLTVKYTRNEKVYLMQYDINVIAKTLTNISIAKRPTKQIYYLNDSDINLEGGELTLEYDNGYPQKVKMKGLAGLTASWDSAVISKASKVSLTYGGKTTSFTVEIIDKNVLEYEILSMPTHIQLVNTPLDLTGLSVAVTFTDGQKEIITVPRHHVYYEKEDFDPDIIYSIYAHSYDTNRVRESQNVMLAFYLGDTQLSNELSIDIVVHDKNIQNIDIYKTLSFDIDNNPINENSVYTMTSFNPFELWSYVLVFNNGEISVPRPLTQGMITNIGNQTTLYYTESGIKELIIEYNDGTYNHQNTYELDVEKLDIINVQLMEKSGDNYINKEYIKVFLENPVNAFGNYLQLTFNNGEMDIIPFSSNMVLDSQFDNGSLNTRFVPILITIENKDILYQSQVPVVMVKKVADKLEIKKEPTAMSYVLFNPDNYDENTHGQYVFDPSGMEIVLRFENESETTLISNFDSSDWVFTSAEWTNSDNYGKFFSLGAKTIHIAYVGLDNVQEQGVSITVQVTNNVNDIEFPFNSLGTINAGAKLDLRNYYIEVVYENGTINRVPLTASMLDYKESNLEIEEARPVVITYKIDGTEFRKYTTVKVTDTQPIGIEITRLPYNLEYIHRKSQALDLNGLRVSLIYSNGTLKQLESSAYSCENFSSENLGEVVITVREGHYDFIAYFNVEIVAVVVESVTWSGAPPVALLQQGESFIIDNVHTNREALSAYKVKIVYSDENEEEVTLSTIMSEFIVGGFNSASAGTQYVELRYRGSQNASLVLTVRTEVTPRALTELSSSFEQFNVVEFSDINLTGAELKLVFDNGLTENTIPLTREHIAYNATTNPDGYNKNDLTIGIRNVSIAYLYNDVIHYVYVRVNVIAKDLDYIEMGQKPKVYYIEGEELDVENGTIILYYNNGTSQTLQLKNAVRDNKNSPFNLDTIKFDNSEFSGSSKLQTIYVNYIFNSKVYSTEYDITMRDRKYAMIHFDSSNIYDFYYGDLTVEKTPKFTVTGYNSFADTIRQLTFDNSRFVVEYIRYDERNSPKDPNKDYTVLPREVGDYLMIISYDSALYDDMIHNSFVTSEQETHIISIKKKKVFVELDATQKIYGTENPQYILQAYGTDLQGNKDINAQPFAYNDNFYSPYFANQLANYGSICYDKNGNPISYVKIQTYNDSGVNVNIGIGTGAGRYRVDISAIESKNYDIVYLTSIFTVEKRKIYVYPQSATMVYGSIQGQINYTTDKIKDSQGNIVADSGLYGDDVLNGALNRTNDNSNAVGRYRVTIGSLNNPNYDIIFNPDNQDICVEITKRNIYLKVNNITKIFGDEIGAFSSMFYKDEACTDTNAFAYTNDRTIGLGTISYYSDVNRLSAVGSYDIGATIEPTENTVNIYNNYNIIYIKGLVAVDKRPIIVTAVADEKVFGEAEPAEFAYQVSAVDGNNSSGLIVINAWGDIDTLKGSLVRQSGNFVGRYAINIGTLASQNPNYDIIYNSAYFTINQKNLYIVIDSQNLRKVYDGKVPSIDEYDIQHTVDGQMISYYSNDFNQSTISIEFYNPSRNVGSYFMAVSNTNSNYLVSFPQGIEYSYEIEPLEVDIEYVDLPHMKEYKGETYEFYAKVVDDMVQKEYNADGSVKTDNNNNEIKDIIDVTLSPVNARNAGSYTVYAIRLSNINYKLSTAAEERITFTIVPRTLEIEVITNNGNTYESVYNAQPAMLYANTNYIVHNNLAGNTININVRVLNPSVEDPNDSTAPAPQDVYYDTDGITILSYSIVADQPSNSNYTVSFRSEYRYKIVPREVKIIMFESSLRKDYDAKPPVVNSTMFYVADTVTNLSQNNFTFSFIREDNDYSRSNSDVGEYAIFMECLDKNHIATADKDYTYTISKAKVTVEILASSLYKTYDGNRAIITQESLRLSAIMGNRPLLRNYLNTEDLQEMQSYFDLLKTNIMNFRNELSNLDFSGDNNAYDIMRCENAIDKAYALIEDFGSQSEHGYLQQNNYNQIISLFGDIDTPALNTVLGRLKDIIEKLRIANLTDAKSGINLVRQIVADIYNIVDSECYYIAFRIVGDDPEVTAIGAYSVYMTQLDYNREYTFLNKDGARYNINPRQITVKTDEVIMAKYGDELPNQQGIDFITLDGDRQVFLDDIQGKLIVDLASSQTGRYGVGTFKIIADEEMKSNANYTLSFILGNYIVEKVDITIQLNLHAGTALDPYPDSQDRIIRYGDIISQERIKHWTYIGGLVAPQPGQPVDPLSTIDANIVAFSCLASNGLPITSEMARPSAGEYAITASGFAANNYNFIVLPGKLTINKRPLRYYEIDGYIHRTYGSPFMPSFIGFAYNETMGNLGDFVAPTPLNPSNPAFLLETSANQNFQNLQFTIDEQHIEQFQNYYFDVDGTYNVRIIPADLTVKAKSLNGSELTAVYGSVPNYDIEYDGFKNQDESQIKHLLSPIMDFKKDVSDLSYFDKITFNQTDRDRLSNYNISIQPVPYIVTPKTLTVKFNKDISIIYNTGSETPYKIEPFLATYNYNTNGVLQSITVTGGQYWAEDIDITGFVYGENEDIFQRFEDIGQDFYLEYSNLFVHELVYEHAIGTGLKIRLNNFRFGQEENNPGYIPNYTINYEETTLNVYSKVYDILMDEDRIVLEGDDAGNMTVVAVTEALHRDTYKLSQLSYNMQYYPQATDINGRAVVTFNKTYVLTGYNGPSRLQNVNVTSTINTQVHNETITKEIPVRIYQKHTVTHNVEIKDHNDDNYAYGTMINANSIERSYLDTNTTNYDKIDTSLRMLPYNNQYRYDLIINSSADGENSLILSIRGGIDYGIVTLTPKINGITGESVVISIGDMDLFDGFTHNLRVYYNKLTNAVSVEVDGYLSEAVVFADDEYEAQEAAISGFTVYGVTAWVRHFVIAKQGYLDNFATNVISKTGNPNMIYVSDIGNRVTLNLTNFFNPSVPRASGYVHTYYLNGKLIAVWDTDNNQLPIVDDVGVGLYLAELEVKNGNTVISRGTVQILITTAAQDTMIDNQVVKPSQPIYLYGYDRNDETNPDDLTMSNDTPVRVPYEIQQTNGNTNYRNIEIAYKVDRATINGDYRDYRTDSQLVLGTSNRMSAPVDEVGSSYYGISLGMAHSYESYLQGYYTTSLNIAVNGQKFSTNLTTNIDWADGAFYTVQAYFDNVIGRGSNSIRIVIYRQNVKVLDITVDDNYTFNNTQNKMTENHLNTLINSTKTASVMARDCRITIRDIKIGSGNVFGYDYLINDSYTQKLNAGNAVGTVSSNSQVALASHNDNALYEMYNQNQIRFRASGSSIPLVDSTLKYYIASSNENVTLGRGIVLTYNGRTKELNFNFYNGATQYANQRVANNLNLFDGAEHTINVRIDRERVAKTFSIPGVTDVPFNTVYYISKVYIIVDGVEYSTALGSTHELSFPHYNSVGGWMTQQGNASPAASVSTGPTFLYSFNYTKVALSNVQMTLYDYQVGYNAVMKS